MHPMGPGILSSTGAGVWRKAPGALPDSSSVLDIFQFAIKHFSGAVSFCRRAALRHCHRIHQPFLHITNFSCPRPLTERAQAPPPLNRTFLRERLGAQCKIPPPRAMPFRGSIGEGASHPFCRAFMWYRTSIAEMPLFLGAGGYTLQGGKAQKTGRGYCTELVMLRHQKPHRA